MLDQVTLNFENGETLSAPTSVWFAALLAELPAAEQVKITQRVGNMLAEAKARSTILKPGHHVLKAEPLELNFSGGVKNNGRV